MRVDETGPLDELLRALAHPARRQILAVAAAGPVSAGAIARSLGLANATTSEHLRVLRKTGLVTMTVQGTWRLYRTDRERVAELTGLLADFTGSLPEEEREG
jgi:DNA-binding transcriptional ArsR family regulator